MEPEGERRSVPWLVSGAELSGRGFALCYSSVSTMRFCIEYAVESGLYDSGAFSKINGFITLAFRLHNDPHGPTSVTT